MQLTLTMTDIKHHSVIAIYDSHTDAESAVKALQQAGLDMTRLSIVGKGSHIEEHAVGYYTAGDRMKFWGGRGAMWGGLVGSLVGSALFLIPVVGPLVVMGPLVGWIASAMEGAAIGGAAGILAASLRSVGIPKDSIVKYELELKQGKFMVLAYGSADMVEHARGVLRTTGASELTAHAA